MKPFEKKRAKRPGQGFFAPDKLENHTSEGKGRRESQERRLEKKPAEENKAMCCTLSSFQFYFGLLDGFELHSRWVPLNVFKNPNRCIRQQINKRTKAICRLSAKNVSFWVLHTHCNVMFSKRREKKFHRVHA